MMKGRNKRGQRGSSDFGMVMTVIGIACVASIVLACNSWIKSKNLAKRGIVEMTAEEYEAQRSDEDKVEYLPE